MGSIPHSLELSMVSVNHKYQSHSTNQNCLFNSSAVVKILYLNSSSVSGKKAQWVIVFTTKLDGLSHPHHHIMEGDNKCLKTVL